jgi:peptidoglycan/xylan/chitin deacetylase (PgdA/CDA1 family)
MLVIGIGPNPTPIRIVRTSYPVSPSLHVVMYHYVRDLPHTRFPKIKGMLTREFREQLALLQDHYEMATLESALEFIQGNYRPVRDLCLLTFDDGLKEHYSEITPLLMDCKIQGLFFVITSCLEWSHVVPVHMNHFLMAALDFEDYRSAFLSRLPDIDRDWTNSTDSKASLAQRVYRWDPPEVASFKYLFNFVLDFSVRNRILKDLFEKKIGDVQSFAQNLYLNVEEARKMQAGGMIIGGHSHQHKPLSSLSDKELESDLALCYESLKEKLLPQPLLPFCYPYGNRDSFNSAASKWLKHLGFACSFSTEVGSNIPGTDAFAIRRFDCNDMGALLRHAVT